MGVFQNHLMAAAVDATADTGGAIDLYESDATADTFVCEFTGTGDETGAGGGLSGDDLILTEAGTVSDASSGWRTLNNGAFTLTTAFFDNFFSGNTGNERTIALYIKNANVTPATTNGFFNWVSSNAYGGIYLQIPSGGAAEDDLRLIIQTGNAGVGVNGTTFTGGNMFGSSDAVWLVWWQDGTYDRFGWVADDAPSNWSDFPSGQRASASFDGSISDSGQGGGYGVGTNNGNTAGYFEINRFIMSKSGTIITND